MSRIGKKPVAIPSGVEVTVNGRTVKVKGPNGELTLVHHPGVMVAVESDPTQIGRAHV